MLAQVRIDFQGRGKVETCPRACVQLIGDGVQLTLGVARQVCALGQVLAQQAIRILVGATLPGAVRIGKEDLDRQPLPQACMLGHLFSSIIRQRFTQQRGHVPEFLREAPSGTRRIGPVHPGQDHQACRPFLTTKTFSGLTFPRAIWMARYDSFVAMVTSASFRLPFSNRPNMAVRNPLSAL